MNQEELIGLAIQERLCACFRNNCVAERRKLCEKKDAWRKQLEAVSPELLKMYEEYLETVAEIKGKEEEAYYRCGFQDGVSLMKRLVTLWEKERG